MARSPRHLAAGQFFGRTEHLSEVSGLVLSEVLYESDQQVPAHDHRWAYFCLLLDGAYSEQYGRRRVSHASGSVVFHPAGDEHHGEIGPRGGRCFNLEIAPGLIERLREHGAEPDEPVSFRGDELTWLSMRLYREFRHSGKRSDLVIEGLSLELLGRLSKGNARENPRPPRWFRAAMDRLHDEYAQTLTVAGVAGDLGVSAIRLSRAFRRYLGLTMGEYLHRIRVNRACRILAGSNTRMADLALDLGFADQSHFCRVFKHYTGFTPSQYRKTRSFERAAD